jgi:hypothetical protein
LGDPSQAVSAAATISVSAVLMVSSRRKRSASASPFPGRESNGD